VRLLVDPNPALQQTRVAAFAALPMLCTLLVPEVCATNLASEPTVWQVTNAMPNADLRVLHVYSL
jgi:hypothetical protein